MTENQPKTAHVVFQPSGQRGHFPIGTPVLEAARQLGVQIESVCGGRGICGKCQIEVAEGHFAKLKISSSADRLSPRGFIENRYDEKRGLAPNRRLSCSTEILGDVVIDVPEASIIAGQTIRKDATTLNMHRNTALRLCYVELAEPGLDDNLGDAERLSAEIDRAFDYGPVLTPFTHLGNVQRVLREAKGHVTACIDISKAPAELITLFPDYYEDLTGLAVDIGSTTIAAHLVDLLTGAILASTGRANPQIRFGEDLMSRVSYGMMNPGGREALTAAVRTALNEMAADLLEKTARSRDGLLEGVFVCNPVMHHLFLGIDPTPLGQAPFNPALSSSVRTDATNIGLEFGTGARIYVLPIIAGHVGADAAAVVLAQKPELSTERLLIVDVGTNAEIVLSVGGKLYAASSPTGPALEGAEISSGQRAAPGAIERIRIDRQTLKPRYRIIGTEIWSDAPGFAEASAATRVTGICGSGIIEIIGEMLLAGIISSDGIIRGPATDAEAERLVPQGRTFAFVVSPENPRLLINQNDIRAIQLAKSALYAGVKLLMDRAGIDALDEIRLAGAFGSYIDPKYALLLGLVPDCLPERVIAIGNAAGQGALIALLDVTQRASIEATTRAIAKIETALEPAFQTHFVNAMGLPNSDDPFPLTRALFDLPPLDKPTGGPVRTGARRRRRD